MALKKRSVILRHAGLVAGCTFILSGNAHAYVDPGTGNTRRALVGMDQTEHDCLDDQRNAERRSTVTQRECDSTH